MDLHTWLDKPENKGQAAELAAHLDVSAAAVSLWRSTGVPVTHMVKIATFTNGAVKITSMVEHVTALRQPRRKAAPVEAKAEA